MTAPITNIVDDECQIAFEKWHDDVFLCKPERRDIPPGYIDEGADAMWTGWQSCWYDPANTKRLKS